MAEQQAGIVGKAKQAFATLRERVPFIDHVMLMVAHYGKVQGNVLAGAITYFGFLSFFPILALAFSVVGFVSLAYPDARDSLVTAIQQVFPGIVTLDGSNNTISLKDIEGAKAAAGIIGFVGVLYSGLNWVSGLRGGLQDAFEVPKYKQSSFVVGKLTDLVALGILGFIMIISVGISGVVKGLADDILDAISIPGSIGKPLLWVVGIALGLAASTLLFYVMFRMLAKPDLPTRPLWQGAFFGAAGFEALKLIVVNVLGSVGGSDFAQLAIAITLVVWINYFSRLVMYGASWAMTSGLSTDAITRRTDHSEATVVQADLADSKARVPVAARVTPTGEAVAGRFDTGSALFGAALGAVAAFFYGRRP